MKSLPTLSIYYSTSLKHRGPRDEKNTILKILKQPSANRENNRIRLRNTASLYRSRVQPNRLNDRRELTDPQPSHVSLPLSPCVCVCVGGGYYISFFLSFFLCFPASMSSQICELSECEMIKYYFINVRQGGIIQRFNQ